MMNETSPDRLTRRTFVAGAPAIAAAAIVLPAGAAIRRNADEPDAASPGVNATFPSQDPAMVREIVGASHRSEARVRELLKLAPRLANATWDWGFGDWETALGAAAHTGRRAIAELLLEHGARADLFCLAMLGRLEAVKAIIESSPGIQRVRGPHGITLLSHARAGGDQAAGVVEYLSGLGDADEKSTDLPISEEFRTAYVGTFAYGPLEGERFATTLDEKGGKLLIRRMVKEGSPIRLTRVAEHEFHPAGAPEVRIRFEIEGGQASRVTITSPAPVCEARRV